MEDLNEIQVEEVQKQQNVQRLSREEKKARKYSQVKVKQLVTKKKMLKVTQEKFKILSEDQKEKYFEVKRQRFNRKAQKINEGIEVFIDLEYDVLMAPREVRSLATQISRVVGFNKELSVPIQVHLTNYVGVQRRELEKQGSMHWLLEKHEEGLEELVPQFNKEFIYLSPDAETELETLDPKKYIYIIGGLINIKYYELKKGFVDRSIMKYMSYNKATALQIHSARLPIKAYMKGRVRPLNIDTVACLLSEYVDCGDWKIAYERASSKNEGLVTKLLKQQNQEQSQEQNQELSQEQNQELNQELNQEKVQQKIQQM